MIYLNLTAKRFRFGVGIIIRYRNQSLASRDANPCLLEDLGT
jgi:hypothetical protein